MSILSEVTERFVDAKELTKPERAMFMLGMGTMVQCILPHVQGEVSTELQVVGQIIALSLQGKSESEIQAYFRI